MHLIFQIKTDQETFIQLWIYSVKISFSIHADDTIGNGVGLDKLRTCVRYVLEIINFTDYRTGLFSNKYFTNTFFQFLEYVKQSHENKRTYI